MSDPRVLRTRTALHEAVAELAGETPIAQVSVSEIAERAGINRATFYKHFATPQEALTSLLEEDLDRLRARSIATRTGLDTNPREAFLATTEEAIDHVDRFRSIYELGFAARTDGIATGILSDHFVESAQQYLEEAAPTTPALASLDAATVAAFITGGLIGVLRGQLVGGSAPRAAILATINQLVPEWWFRERTPN